MATGLQLGIRGKSVVVVSCAPKGPADRCGQILKFDTVLEIDGKAPGSTMEEVCNQTTTKMNLGRLISSGRLASCFEGLNEASCPSNSGGTLFSSVIVVGVKAARRFEMIELFLLLQASCS
jgi:hypothetical protein